MRALTLLLILLSCILVHAQVHVAVMPAASPRDPYFSNVVLLFHFDGANGSTTFTDVKGHTVVTGGTAQITTAASRFGGASLYVDGDQDYLRILSASDLQAGTGDFTMEMWIRTSDPDWGSLFSNGPGDPGTYWFGISGRLFLYDGGGIYSSPSAVNTGAPFKHVAASRNSGTIRLYVDGVLVTSASDTSDYSLVKDIYIGHDGSPADGFDYEGYIDELRFTVGVGRYPAAFTPPTSPFPNR